MQISKASRRYASALLQISVEQNKLEKVLEDVNLINDTLENSRDLVLMFKSPIIKSDDKSAVVDKVFGDQLDDITSRFLHLLIKKQREDLVDEIFPAFIDVYNEYTGILNITILTARKLSQKRYSQIEDVFAERTGKKIQSEVEVDEKLKGGIAVRVNDTVIDGTVKHKLDQLEQLFMSTNV